MKICLLGLGRTGSVVAEQLLKTDDLELAAVITSPGSSKANRSLREFINCDTDLVIRDASSLAEECRKTPFTVAIDFTKPEASLHNARILAEHDVHLVIGTTGFNKLQLHELQGLVRRHHIGLVYAPNISVGINLLLILVQTLAALVPQYDIEITELHHRYKKDAPSSTALKIASTVNAARGIKGREKLCFGRKGATPREAGEIGIHAIRAGGIAGVHRILFAGDNDELEITHRSYSRAVFAEGALEAARFVAPRKGFFNMEGVLAFTDTPDTEAGPDNLQFNYY
ncbi:MAG TPA: 4-hydroxy-tetrahydrodipicolinate reductase [Bacillota bacterium]